MSEEKDRLSGLRIDRRDEDEGSPWLRRGILLVVAVVLAALPLWWFLGRDRALAVEVATVSESERGAAVVSVLDASGYVTARRQATVSSKITGKIVEVFVEEGMAVSEGQMLARLDDSLVRKQLALAEAREASSRSRLREIEVRRDEALINLKRTRELLAGEAASQFDLDAAQAQYDAYVARLEATRDEITVARSEVALRRQEIEDHLVRAPFDGVAISKNAQPGEMISPMSAGGSFTRTGVSTIVDMGSLEIEVDVNEAFINRVQNGQRVVATLDAYPDWKIPCYVITTIPAADRQKATVRVRIGFDELGDPRLLPDMGVRVSFRSEEEPPGEQAAEARVVLVPAGAVREEGGATIVFVLEGETVERRAVALGGESSDRREVLSGLRPGERVVIEAPETLTEGDRVSVQ